MPTAGENKRDRNAPVEREACWHLLGRSRHCRQEKRTEHSRDRAKLDLHSLFFGRVRTREHLIERGASSFAGTDRYEALELEMQPLFPIVGVFLETWRQVQGNVTCARSVLATFPSAASVTHDKKGNPVRKHEINTRDSTAATQYTHCITRDNHETVACQNSQTVADFGTGDSANVSSLSALAPIFTLLENV